MIYSLYIDDLPPYHIARGSLNVFLRNSPLEEPILDVIFISLLCFSDPPPCWRRPFLMSDSDPYCCFQIQKVESILDDRFVFLMLFSDLLVEPILMSVRFASICKDAASSSKESKNLPCVHGVSTKNT